MIKKIDGFTAIEVAIGVVVLGLGGCIGYGFFLNSHQLGTTNQTVQPDQQTQVLAPIGTTANIDNLMAQDADSETSIDTSHMSTDQTNVRTTDTAASNIGGAYNESSF